MDKPTKPTNLIPRSFGGVKNNFSESLQSSGYEDGVPAIYGGDNLNYQLDATGKELDYCEKICDFINELPIGKTITTNPNNKLVYTDIVDSADSDLSNLTETGEKHFLNKQQITNCLLEVPNNIKLELNNGTLTLKAGSKVIVPNGFEQDGVTPKFDEVIIESDITNTPTSLVSVPCMVAIDPDGQTLYAGRCDRAVSGATDSITGYAHWWYDTTNNLVKRISASNVLEGYASLPVGIGNRASSGTTGWISINQVFNGFGYIGGVMWADKGIKCLIPNGRNADGSLNNIEHTLSNLSVRDLSSQNDANYTIHLNANILGYENQIGVFGDKMCYYDAGKNYNFHIENNTVVIQENSLCGEINIESGKITRMTFNNALNLSEMCDGHWVSSGLSLASGVTYPTSTDTEYDLTSYLPADGYAYEVLVDANVATGTTSGNTVTLQIKSNIIQSAISICTARTRASANTLGAGATIIPIGADRKLILVAYSSAVGTYSMQVKGYRRVGLNY